MLRGLKTYTSTINTIHLLFPLDFSSSPHHFFFTSPFLLPKKHFSKLLNLPSLISLNIFLDPCVLENFCYTPIFGETHFQTHLFFASKCHLLPMDHFFLLLVARNSIHHLNGMMRGSFKTPRPMLHILTWTSRWVFSLVPLFGKMLFHVSLKVWWWDIVILLSDIVGIWGIVWLIML